MNVSDIMTSPAPTCTIDTTVEDLARRLLEEGRTGLVVVNADGAPVGLISRHDLVAKHARVHAPWYLGILGGVLPLDRDRTEEELKHVLAVTAGDLMNREPRTIDASAAVDDAASLLLDERVECVLVLNGGMMIGLLSEEDILRLLLLEERDEGAVEGD